MPIIKSHADSSVSDDEPEADPARKEEVEGDRKPSTRDNAKPDESGTRVVKAGPEDRTDRALSTLLSSEPNRDRSKRSIDISSTSDEDEIWFDGQLEEPEAEKLDTTESDEYMPPDVRGGLEESSDADRDTEVESDEPEEDIDVKVMPARPRDETDVSKSDKGEAEAYVGGTVGLYYLRGLLCHESMNLDDAIRYLRQSLELAVEMDLFDYVVKSQIQLASICLKRYQIHGSERDYYSSLHYSENLIQIAKELELDELWTEALLLRAILRKIARDVNGARDDLNQARAMAKSTGKESVEALIEHELQEVRRLSARASRKKHQDEDNNGHSVVDDALEVIPAIFGESLKLKVSREFLEISVELSRLIIMNLASGLPLYTYSFDGHLDGKGDLVYGFLSALSHLSSEVMDRPGMIRSISYEGRTVMMEHREAYMGALFASCEDFRARQSLQKFLREALRLLPEMRAGEVITEEYRFAADEMLRRIFKAYL